MWLEGDLLTLWRDAVDWVECNILHLSQGPKTKIDFYETKAELSGAEQMIWEMTGVCQKNATSLFTEKPPQKRKQYIGVTDFIQKLTDKNIHISPGVSKEDAFKTIIQFLFDDYMPREQQGYNRNFLKGLAYPQDWIGDERMNLMNIALRRKLTKDELEVVNIIKEYWQKLGAPARDIYEQAPKLFERTIAILMKEKDFNPLREPDDYSENWREEMIKKYDFSGNKLRVAIEYLHYKGWEEVFNEILSNNKLSKRNEDLIRKSIQKSKSKKSWYMETKKTVSPEVLKDGIYLRYFNNDDHPFCFTADELLKYKLSTGCSHHAITFMALAKALGYTDLRLVIAVSNYLYNTKHCRKGRGTVPMINSGGVGGHKVVMVKTEKGYGIIDTSNPNFYITYQDASGNLFTPDDIIGRDLKFAGFGFYRVRAIGKDSNDYISDGTNAMDATIGMTRKDKTIDKNCVDYPMPVVAP